MANYQSLKTAINAVIKANGNKEITGTVLNEVLLAMVNSLGAGYQFAGVATPSTNPGTPDQKVFYIASQAGTYTNFNGAVVSDGIAIFEWNGTWTTEILDLSMAGQVQSDWTETDTTKKSYIKHKPNIPPSANVDPVPTEDSPNAVSSGGTYDMIVNTATTLFGDIQDATNVNAIASVDGKIYNDYQAGDIFFIVDNNVRKYRVALIAGTADAEHPVTISPVNFYYALNSADAINLSLTLKTVSTEQQSLSTQQKAQARTNIAAVSYEQQSLNAGQQVQAQNNMMGKAYAPAQNSGLGKVYLDKNNGVLTQSMMPIATQEGEEDPGRNTIYVIQYDFTLGEDITVPENCILEFDGGSLSGGTVDFNGAIIDADKNSYIFKNLANFYNLKECSIKWFGAKGDGETDDTSVFKFVINRNHNESSITKHLVVHVPFGIYIISDCINPGAYTNEDYTYVSIIGDDGIGISQYIRINDIKGSNRAVLYCVGNLTTKPYLYAPALLKHISLRGEDNGDISSYNDFLPRYETTLGISVSIENGYATYRELEDVEVHFFGTGIEEKDSFGGNWNHVDVCANCYGVKIIPQNHNITMQTINHLGIHKTKYDGLTIAGNYESLIVFNDLIAENADCLNNPSSSSYESSEKYYCIKADNINVINGYTENSFNDGSVVNVNVGGGLFINYRFVRGVYNFTGDTTIISPMYSQDAVLKLNNTKSCIINAYIKDISDYENAFIYNCTAILKQGVLNKNIRSLTKNDRPYANNYSGGSELHYDKDSKTLVFWNGTNWSDFNGVNVSNVTIPGIIGSTTIRESLNLGVKQKGFRFYDTTLDRLLIWNGSYWYDCNGFLVGKAGGTTEQMPSFPTGIASYNKGYTYYNDTYSKEVFYTGGRWVDSYGFTGLIRHKGTTAQRNVAENSMTSDDIGFCYYDTTLEKPVWLKSIVISDGVVQSTVWIDATGTPV